ncbi:hypothetical protein M422DRAFT_50324 [Sphaerobolus stellatus SS14]|uniref:Uncharacterized protein n=1 Tax=Sphaerobolus stellatus (strain SS14) TaxID=990650 RepID=A0A0C9VIW6_SPHS4|nr:hypothetical protein M422DRAFT_50324 [Sphaerobolus stellatus SS14]
MTTSMTEHYLNHTHSQSIIIPKATISASNEPIQLSTQNVYAVSSQTFHSSEYASSIIHVTAPTSLSLSVATSLPSSPYQEAGLASMDRRWLILCSIVAAALGALIGWFVVPLFFPRWRSRCNERRKDQPAHVSQAGSDTENAVFTGHSTQTPRRLSAFSGGEHRVEVIASGAQKLHEPAEAQSRKRGGIRKVQEDDPMYQTPSRVRGQQTNLILDMAPPTPVPSRRTIISPTPERPTSKVSPNRRCPPSLALSRMDEDRTDKDNKSGLTGRKSPVIEPLTPITATARVPIKRPEHMRRQSLPSSFPAPKRSSACLDLTALVHRPPSTAPFYPSYPSAPPLRRVQTAPLDSEDFPLYRTGSRTQSRGMLPLFDPKSLSSGKRHSSLDITSTVNVSAVRRRSSSRVRALSNVNASRLSIDAIMNNVAKTDPQNGLEGAASRAQGRDADAEKGEAVCVARVGLDDGAEVSEGTGLNEKVGHE